jgi:hypothetical protein
LITFYAEWQRDSRRQPSGYEYCRERLAKPHKQSTVMLDGMIEDADAYHVAMRVRGGSTIVHEMESLLLHGGHRSRFRRHARATVSPRRRRGGATG